MKNIQRLHKACVGLDAAGSVVNEMPNASERLVCLCLALPCLPITVVRL